MLLFKMYYRNGNRNKTMKHENKKQCTREELAEIFASIRQNYTDYGLVYCGDDESKITDLEENENE